MIFFMNQNLTKQKKEEGILVYSSSQTLFTWIVFSFPFLCFFPIYVFLLSIFFKFLQSSNIRFIWDWASYFFEFIFMRLCQSHNLNHEFDSVYLSFSSFSWLLFFFNFIFEYWVDSELGFLICFSLNSMRLSSCHDSGHEFSMLT